MGQGIAFQPFFGCCIWVGIISTYRHTTRLTSTDRLMRYRPAKYHIWCYSQHTSILLNPSILRDSWKLQKRPMSSWWSKWTVGPDLEPSNWGRSNNVSPIWISSLQVSNQYHSHGIHQYQQATAAANAKTRYKYGPTWMGWNIPSQSNPSFLAIPTTEKRRALGMRDKCIGFLVSVDRVMYCIQLVQNPIDFGTWASIYNARHQTPRTILKHLSYFKNSVLIDRVSRNRFSYRRSRKWEAWEGCKTQSRPIAWALLCKPKLSSCRLRLPPTG